MPDIECLYCETREGEGLEIMEAEEKGWTDIEEMDPADVDDVLNWGTNWGVCPVKDCQDRQNT